MVDNNIEHMNDLRKRSGTIISTDPLVSFLYELMRDHVCPGQIEYIMTQTNTSESNYETTFTNGWLAEYAMDIAKRLRGSEIK